MYFSNIILNSMLCIVSFLVAFGKLDPFFYNSEISSMYLFLGIYLLFFTLFRMRMYVENFPKLTIYILVIVIFLFLSEIVYGDSIYSASIFNVKLMVCAFLFSVLVVQFRKDQASLIYSMAFYALGSLFFSIYVFLSPELMEIRGGRYFIAEENPNSTSSRLAIAITIAFYLAIENPMNIKSKLVRVMMILANIPLFILIMNSGSRGGLLTMIGSVLLYLTFSSVSKRVKWLILSTLLLLSFFLSGYLLQFDAMIDRLIISFVDGDTGGRGEIWSNVMAIISNNILIGVGERGYFSEMYNLSYSFIDTHNLYLYILASGGVLSFIPLVAFQVKIFSSAYKELKLRNVLPILLFLNVNLIAIRTGGVLTYFLMWYLLAMAVSFKLYQKNI